MAYWSETRGLTLRLTGPEGTARFVRLTLVERRGLLGSWLNVREARAERAADEKGLPSALGEGRLLSWRPLPKRDAEGLMTQRTRTLERIGYTVIHSSESEREPWAWLQDLVHRQLRRPKDSRPAEQPSRPPDQELRDEISEAIANVEADLEQRATQAEPKVDPEAAREDAVEEADEAPEPTLEALVSGFADLVKVDADTFANPAIGDLARVDLDALAPLLDQLVESQRPELRAMASRWIELPALVYELDPAMIERWLEEGRAAARLIAPRLPAEGLALCGEGSLRRLSQRSRSPRIRQFAGKWVSRLEA